MTKLTSERLAELRRLCDAATPGPWEVEWNEPPDQRFDFPLSINSPGQHKDILETDWGIYGPRSDDARLIAAARTALPELLEAVAEEWAINEKLLRDREEDARTIERLQAENNALRLGGQWHPPWHPCGTRRDLSWTEEVGDGSVRQFEYKKCPTCPPEPEGK